MTSPRMKVRPELLQWACRRRQADPAELRKRFPKYDDWESGAKNPTYKQLEDFARFMHIPVGLLFFSEPLDEPIPVHDLRTMSDQKVLQPSDNLLDTIYMCQQRQDWYQTFAVLEGEEPLPFVGSATVQSDIKTTAREIRATLSFDIEERQELPNWAQALRYFTNQADDLGILVMISGVVRNNPHRKLDPEEFRGFALADKLAPLIFINGADTRAAQIFTLAHELAHIWLGESSLSNVTPDSFSPHRIERWCNQVAAEVLVPITSLHESFQKDASLADELRRLARYYKTSTLVLLRRLFEMKALQRSTFAEQYQYQLSQLKPRSIRGGGSFHATLKPRVGQRFGTALVESAFSGETAFTDALYYLGIKKISTLEAFAESLQEA